MGQFLKLAQMPAPLLSNRSGKRRGEYRTSRWTWWPMSAQHKSRGQGADMW